MSIIGVASASGVGKTTLIRTFLRIVPHSTLLTSTTTRRPRESDYHDGTVHEYEYVTREKFAKLESDGAFLDTFGEEHKAQYGTRATIFEQALQSSQIFLAALYVPGVELFFDEARALHRESSMHAVFLDLEDEEERRRRLHERGETDLLRYEDELMRWRNLVAKSDAPFFILQATESPEALVHQVINKFGIKTEN